ncbi:MAG: AzlC family ABC transporter permease [Eubacteriaceae bacterium]|nr:AzlC family ABC transporter permease [Eubacteriaceae bacterium]
MVEEEKNLCHNQFDAGFRHGIPIGLGYLSVSFTFGMMAVSEGMPAWSAILISFTNLTSAGQFAGLDIIAAQGPLLEMAMVQLVINLRYALMSLSWSQKLDASVTLPQRLLIAFADTDEIFAVSSGQDGTLGFKYMLGLMIAPIIGWTAGTTIGAIASSLLPDFIRSALGIAIYGMFLAIIVPPSRDKRPVRIVVLVAVTISCLLHYAPVLQNLSSGFAIIICAVAASAIGAWRYPVKGDNLAASGESGEVLS